MQCWKSAGKSARVAVVAMSLLCGSLACAQDPPAEEITPEQQALLAEYDQQFAKFVEFYNARKTDEAIAAGLKAVETSERIMLNRIETAVVLEAVGGLYELQGDLQRALALYRRLADITTTLFGQDYYETADKLWMVKRLENLVALKPEEFEQLKRAQKLEVDALTALNKGENAEAVQLATESLAIREKLLPTPNPQILSLVRLLGLAHLQQRQLQEAARYVPAALAMTEELYPEEKYPAGHPDLIRALSNMASFHNDTGDLTGAHADMVRALDVAEALFPVELGPRLELAKSLANLGYLEVEIGDFGAAQVHLERAIGVFEQIPAMEHDVVQVKQHLGRTLMELGDVDGAQAIFEANIAFLEELDAAGSTPQIRRELVQAHIQMAEMHNVRKQHAAASAQGQKAVAIAEGLFPIEQFPQGHPFLIGVWNTQAQLLEQIDELKASREYMLRALEAAERLYTEEEFPRGNNTFASLLNSLGISYLRSGELDQAQHYLGRSRAMYKKIYASEFYPDGHPRLFSILTNYACLEARRGNLHAALELLLEVNLMQLTATEDILGDVSEQTMHRYFGQQQGLTNLLLTVISKMKDPPSGKMDQAYSILSDRKTAVLDAMLRFRGRQLALSDDEELLELSRSLQAARQELANQALGGKPSSDAVDPAKQVAELEAKLNQRLSAFELDTPPKMVVIPKTLEELSPDSALVDVMRYRPFDFEKLERTPDHYGAIVLRGKQGSYHQFIDLGPAEKIDELVAEIRRQVEQTGRAITTSDEKELEDQYKVPARQLHDLFFKPLEHALDGAKLLFVCPDGELTRIPLEALVDEQGDYIIESHAISYVNNSSTLILGKPKGAEGTVVFAAPDFKFNGAPTPPTDELAALLRGAPETEYRSAVPGDLRGLNWSPLPATVKEAAGIAEILAGNETYGPVVQATGAAALEETLKGLRAPRILHLATHGYYLPSQTPEGEQEGDAATAERGGLTAAQGLGTLKKQDNPLLRSGIVLAGANRPASDDESAPAEARDDGWVTAEEIGMLNLHGTELVVLSACETGLGDLRSGEGVAGLRRAFSYAGAGTLVTSLYKVPDSDTQKLMVDFYRGLADGKSKSAALRNAELKAIDERRKAEGAAHPFFWASFILIGDPR